jgi:F0F1-type ATP synthase assembly protein I
VEFLTLGLSAAVALMAGAGLGYLVDRWAGTSPVFTLVGVVLGLAMAVAMTVAQVRKHLR